MSSDPNRNSINDEDDDGEGSLKAIGVFKNRKFENSPCFRDSFLFGISGGLVTGVLYFMFTSQIGRATNVGVYSFCGILTSYYFYCRHRRAQDRFKYQRIKLGLQKYIEMRGREDEDEE